MVRKKVEDGHFFRFCYFGSLIPIWFQKLRQEVAEKSKSETKNPFIELRKRVIQFLHQVFDRHLGDSQTSCIPSKQVISRVTLRPSVLMVTKRASDIVEIAALLCFIQTLISIH